MILPPSGCFPISSIHECRGGRIRLRREELHDAFHVGGDHCEVKLDLHLGQAPVPCPGQAVKMFEFGHLRLDPAALALIILNPAVRALAPQGMAQAVGE